MSEPEIMNQQEKRDYVAAFCSSDLVVVDMILEVAELNIDDVFLGIEQSFALMGDMGHYSDDNKLDIVNKFFNIVNGTDEQNYLKVEKKMREHGVPLQINNVYILPEVKQ